jgi:hypothetical protein
MATAKNYSCKVSFVLAPPPLADVQVTEYDDFQIIR